MQIINIAHAGVIENATPLTKVGTNILSFVLSSFAVIAIIMSVVYGIMYLTAYGDEGQIEKAKEGFYYAVVGLFISLGCLALEYTMGKFFP
jgi:hypothetical protein